MKKKKTKNRDNSEFKPLSDELGIEPPKIYRSEQRQRINADYYDRQNGKTNSKRKSKTRNRLNNNNRKPQQKRKLKSKYRKILYAFVFALLTAMVLVILSLTVLFKIETISVVGNEKYPTEQVIQNVPIDLQSNLFLADTKNAQKMLETNLPYIYKANIKRKIPSTIVVEIDEADAFYTAKNIDSTYILMDDNFKVLEVGLEYQPENTLLLDSVAIEGATLGNELSFSDENIKDSIKSVNEEVKNLKIAEITGIYATDENHNYVIYDNRLVFNLGNKDNLENKLYTALACTEQLQETNPLIEGEINVANGKQYYFTEKEA